MKKIFAVSAAVLAIPLLLAGCSFSANLTTSAQSVADQAAQALQEQLGTEAAPEMDCGDDAVALVDGTVVDCILTDPTNGLEYDTTVTLSEVDGTDFHIDVQVADTANNADETQEETTSTGDLTVPSTDLATLATGALEPELGFSPEIYCSPAEVPLVVDEETLCMITDPDGNRGTVSITITKVDGTDYAINAKVI